MTLPRRDRLIHDWPMSPREHAERALLGTFLYTPAAVTDELLFFFPECQTVYRAVLATGGNARAVAAYLDEDAYFLLRSSGVDLVLDLMLEAAEPVFPLDQLLAIVRTCPRCGR